MAHNYWQKFEENEKYHVYNRSINKTVLFKNDSNFSFFLTKWKQLITPFFHHGAYCLMPDHFHFLIWLKPIDNKVLKQIQKQETLASQKYLNDQIDFNTFLEDQFKRLFSSYALTYNKLENRKGSLFQKRFKRIAIQDDNRLFYILAYIHHNPIHHGYASNFTDWKYSSFRSFLKEKSSSLISRNEVFSWFEENYEDSKEGFFTYHQQFQLEKSEDFS